MLMRRHRNGLADELKAAGFSTRTCNALIYGVGLRSLDEVRTAEGGSKKSRTGLAWELSILANFGQKGLFEVEAFRAGRDPRTARSQDRQTVAVSLAGVELDILDAWIAEQTDPEPSRPAAIRAMMQATLQDGPPIRAARLGRWGGSRCHARGSALSQRVGGWPYVSPHESTHDLLASWRSQLQLCLRGGEAGGLARRRSSGVCRLRFDRQSSAGREHSGCLQSVERVGVAVIACGRPARRPAATTSRGPCSTSAMSRAGGGGCG